MSVFCVFLMASEERVSMAEPRYIPHLLVSHTVDLRVFDLLDTI